ncbi:MAG: ADP-ribosylglycohydrolase family protein [Thermomicrobiales bacterium]
MPDSNENRFLGALLGMGIGDALGAPMRGLSRGEIASTYGVVDRYHGVAIPDAAEVNPGEFTDETEFALCIIESMTVNEGCFDPETAGVRMLHLAAGPSRNWMDDSTKAALDRAAETLEFTVPMSDDDVATGSVASRGVPIGLIHSMGTFDPDRLRQDVEAVVRLTHGSPAAFNAATAVALGVRLAARGEPRETWAGETAAFLGTGDLAIRLQEIDGSIRAGCSLTEILDASGTGSEAIQVVPAAFAAAMLEPEFARAVAAALAAGGATDTIGALTGALAGAANGASGIPQRLIDGLEGRIYLSLAGPWFFKAARKRAGQVIDLRPVHGPRPELPPRY